MRFEKLNEDKIRITLSHQDLIEKDIDFHSFMANSIESQDLFFDMLDKAEKEIGFVTKDYRIHIEALAVANGDFVLTITRSLPETTKQNTRKKVQVKRKKAPANIAQAIYSFACFEDYCSFIEFFASHKFPLTNLAKSILLYEYRNTYYLVLKDIYPTYPVLKQLFSSLTEFATFVNHSDLFACKLSEVGTIVMKHNAIKTGLKHFVFS